LANATLPDAGLSEDIAKAATAMQTRHNFSTVFFLIGTHLLYIILTWGYKRLSRIYPETGGYYPLQTDPNGTRDFYKVLEIRIGVE
jgi:hypothetical protein